MIRAIGDTIAFSPPLIMTASEIATMISRFGAALEETAASLAKQG